MLIYSHKLTSEGDVSFWSLLISVDLGLFQFFWLSPFLHCKVKQSHWIFAIALPYKLSANAHKSVRVFSLGKAQFHQRFIFAKLRKISYCKSQNWSWQTWAYWQWEFSWWSKQYLGQTGSGYKKHPNLSALNTKGELCMKAFFRASLCLINLGPTFWYLWQSPRILLLHRYL